MAINPKNQSEWKAGMELNGARSRKQAEVAAKLRTDLLAVFASWTVGEQYDFDGARQALDADLEKGDFVRAIAGVQTFRPNDASLNDHRTAVLSALNAAAQKFTALQAATTIEAINAIG